MLTFWLIASAICLPFVFLVWVLHLYYDMRKECERCRQAYGKLSKINKQKEKEHAQQLKDYQKECVDWREALVGKYQAQFDIDHTHTISQALSGQSANILQNKMKEIIEKTYSRMSQEFLGNIGDETDEFLVQLKAVMCEEVWNSLQQVFSRNEPSPMVLPENTKMAFTKGNRTVFVIEQKPQVRSVSFVPKLLSNKEQMAGTRTSNGNYRFSLAFPYICFVLVFDDELFAFQEIYFRNKPLTSPREHLYMAPLPNIWRTERDHKAVCMGNDFVPQDEGPIARQAELAISEFWQRTFNDHLGNGGKIDKRIASYYEWQARTEKDPLFILKMKWGRGNTAKNLIDKILKQRTMNHPTDSIDTETRKLLESGVSQVIKKIKSEIDSAKKNHTLRSGEIDDIVKENLLEVVTDHSRRVFANCSEI